MSTTQRTAKPGIEAFLSGKHTSMQGETIEYSKADLKATAAAYDPKLREAPIVLGHPKHDAPAYGWLKRVEFDDNARPADAAHPEGRAGLRIIARKVAPELVTLHAEGRYAKRSMAFIKPDSPTNPVPGVYYPHHLGILGAMAPAVQGLEEAHFGTRYEDLAEFAEDDFLVVEESEDLAAAYAETTGDEANVEPPAAAGTGAGGDAAGPTHSDAAAAAAASPATPDPAVTHSVDGSSANAAGSGDQSEGDEMSQADKERLTALEAENARLTAEAKARKDRDDAEAEERRIAAEKAAKDASHAENAAYAEGLVKAGQLLPVHQAELVAYMDSIPADAGVVEYGEGDQKVSKSGIEILKDILGAIPKQVEYGETAKKNPDGSESGTVEYAAPAGYTVDAEQLEKHGQALAYQKTHAGVSYTEAVAAVSKG